ARDSSAASAGSPRRHPGAPGRTPPHPAPRPRATPPPAPPGAASAAVDELYRKLVPLGRIGRPEEVARLALFLSSEDSSYVTGQPFVVDGGWLTGVSVF
ncbi:SDR family oxidoreductase, partial [Streptomyces hygroscopicus]|uniref:SDR family oxidoreductase n=1 Tax=Streptomyces hygroscopicus TaxID=1912 RepID=UPI0036931A1A